MKIIEALKGLKELERKKADLIDKIKRHSAYLSYETPIYADQKLQVEKWIQSAEDILKEILRLRLAVQKTNLEMMISIDIDGKTVEKSIAAWIHRRRDLASEQVSIWRALDDRNLKEGQTQQSNGDVMTIKIIRCYDAAKRDERIELFSNEKFLIDSRLEIINATTDLCSDDLL